MKSLIIITALMSSFNLRADLLGFCFSPSTNIKNVQSYLRQILLPSEQVYLRRSLNCVEVEAKSHRKGLIDKFIKVKFDIIKRYEPGLQGANPSSFSAAPARCRLELIRTGEAKSKTFSVDIGRRNDLRESKAKQKTVSKSQILLSSGKPGRLKLDDRDLQVLCRSRGRNNYELEFSFESKRNSVVTSVTISRGQSVDLGSIVDDLNSKNRDLSIQDGINYSKTKGKSKARFELKVK